MDKVIKILMNRDDIDYDSAKTLVQETIDEIIQHPNDSYEIIQEYLGLEPDYLEDLIT